MFSLGDSILAVNYLNPKNLLKSTFKVRVWLKLGIKLVSCSRLSHGVNVREWNYPARMFYSHYEYLRHHVQCEDRLYCTTSVNVLTVKVSSVDDLIMFV